MRGDDADVNAAEGGIAESRSEIIIENEIGRCYIAIALCGVYEVYIVVFTYLLGVEGFGTVGATVILRLNHCPFRLCK